MIFPSFHLRVEKWKWNKEYRVWVSTQGKFRDEHKQPLPIKINQSGYVSVKTSIGVRRAHRLVLLTWLPCPDSENLTVDHLDHNKRNNALNNLEWVTEQENSRRARQDSVADYSETNVGLYYVDGVLIGDEKQTMAMIKVFKPKSFTKNGGEQILRQIRKGCKFFDMNWSFHK